LTETPTILFGIRGSIKGVLVFGLQAQIELIYE
jgi:hypothetical protein